MGLPKAGGACLSSVGAGGLVVVPGWQESLLVASTAESGQILAGLLSWGGGGEAFPQGCSSLAHRMCGAAAAWPNSAAQEASSWSRPGTRAVPGVGGESKA